jgi:hypothetical protein
MPEQETEEEEEEDANRRRPKQALREPAVAGRSRLAPHRFSSLVQTSKPGSAIFFSDVSREVAAPAQTTCDASDR